MTNATEWLVSLVFIAGIGQLLLASGSLAIPRVLRWRTKLSVLPPLERRLFWVYAGYIFGTNAAFGLVSVLLPHALCAGSPLSVAVCGFIGVYWTARLVIQFACFHGTSPSGTGYRLGEFLLTGLFLFFAATYVTAAFIA